MLKPIKTLNTHKELESLSQGELPQISGGQADLTTKWSDWLGYIVIQDILSCFFLLLPSVLPNIDY